MYKLNLSAKELGTIEAALILRRIDCQQWPQIYQDEIADIIALSEKLKIIRYVGEED
ncbi:MAG: hypothetical protein HFF22_08410 [Oscillospiraceae bacterium]|jgi:hypothetical protein|nr:hypothetical protein [Oscillospiraceae bacterium]